MKNSDISHAILLAGLKWKASEVRHLGIQACEARAKIDDYMYFMYR